MSEKGNGTPTMWTAYLIFATTFFFVSIKDMRELWAIDDFRVKILPLLSLAIMVYYSYRLSREKKTLRVVLGFLVGLLIGGLYSLV